ncbi:hypothetical protein MUS1_12400 [Marinomonas ushuaiensis DSM 15871]|uniref:Nitrate/nitrite sensing protein domain-containing protein n=1 Tax=Marinomonas ushuaiensis DSM 15871 TaxID=1122207 RepID=X7E5N7_9GAMM|nr:hypothetical protein [Marinomonas ushuaiensis]ETX11185.1 hypothetical protein MUS1_12400 [Marinomonas ushuaiensis DSM 15871]
MMLTSLFFLTCLTIILMAIGRQIWSKKASKERTLMGVSGITVFIELIKFTQQHRGMHSGFLNGKLDFEAKLPILEENINTLYSNLLSFEKTHNYPTSLSAHYPFKQWQRLIKNNEITSAESFQLHSGLITRQLDAVWDMADEFSLTSNHHEYIRNSAQQLVKTLPELAEALGQIRALSVQVSAKQEMSADKKLQLLFTLGKIEEHHRNLTLSLARSTDRRLTMFIAEIKQSTKDSTLCQQNPDTIFQEATHVINEVFVFILAGFDDLKTKIKSH